MQREFFTFKVYALSVESVSGGERHLAFDEIEPLVTKNTLATAELKVNIMKGEGRADSELLLLMLLVDVECTDTFLVCSATNHFAQGA